MIICHDKKFVFIHSGKCAGTSIEKTILRDNPNLDFEPLPEGDSRVHHAPYYLLMKLREDLKDYFVFTSVRNPWDRQVSWYYHLVTNNLWNSSRYKDFNHWLTFDKIVIFFYDLYKMDFIIKYENLEEDYDKFCSMFSLKNNGLLINDHNTVRPDKDYRNLYNEKSIDLVRQKNIDVISMFNYDF